MAIPHSDAWLQYVAPRLQATSFVPLHPQTYHHLGFMFAARRTRFEFTKFGMSEAFFVFAQIESLTPQLMMQFSQAAFQFAVAAKTVPFPCGLFESVWCFAVAITYQMHPQTADWIRNTEPPKHWSAGEMPVAFDTANGGLCYFEQTPLWGAAYYRGFRQEIERNLR